MTQTDVPLFAGATFDRADHLRADIAQTRADPAARTAVLWRGKTLFDDPDAPRIAWLPFDHPILGEATDPPLFLGLDTDGAPRFATDISPWHDPNADEESLGRFVDNSENRHPCLLYTSDAADD